ncbi:hypothetical protein [Microbacter margulisiae]|uniref:Uncharacterized protein n=1 Tax=Microbacter margulisiae TaxID=1350067 RepID=A0A7W5H1Q4_9PORP|nr:hypothetical protein [Microbacter margulisiae]MBB3186617.1 hypothetical protein [Microbacter margulisiae]
MRFHSHRRKIWIFPLVLVVVAAVILVTMLLWNALLPGLFKAPLITYWQAAGLLLLSRLLLGGFHHFHDHAHSHKNRFRERWEHLNPEEREEAFRKWEKLHAVWQGRTAREETAGNQQ